MLVVGRTGLRPNWPARRDCGCRKKRRSAGSFSDSHPEGHGRASGAGAAQVGVGGRHAGREDVVHFLFGDVARRRLAGGGLGAMLAVLATGLRLHGNLLLELERCHHFRSDNHNPSILKIFVKPPMNKLKGSTVAKYLK